MKNITVSLDDETYRNARVQAAALDTSVSALVKRYLTELGAGDTEFQRLKRLQQELSAQIPADFSASGRLTRDQVHDRNGS
ncbi:hypothetical protein [Rhodopila sp.]|uniref:hypothetical protein n=1 Tax=Rhodopila sp. TaxID=2480087 RepID=UPI003D0D02A4